MHRNNKIESTVNSQQSTSPDGVTGNDISSIQPRPLENRFILFSALLTGGFLINEIYRIHIYSNPKSFVNFLLPPLNKGRVG
ncbi:MAG: hypothetical protein WBA89_12725, partial [Microcoleus sp.]